VIAVLVTIGCSRLSRETRVQQCGQVLTWRAIHAGPDPSALFEALGAEAVKQRAAEGEGEAQFSQGCRLVCEGDDGVSMGAGGRTPMADVGPILSTEVFQVDHRTEVRRCSHLTKSYLLAGPWAEEGMALLEKAAGQGHAYAMHWLAGRHRVREEYEQAVEWSTKGAEAGLPKAMFALGCCLDAGEGVAAPDYPAAVDWYRRAADAGVGEAAFHLSNMYFVGRCWAWPMMPATSCAL
jgi:TPR repeat protein